MDVNRGGHSMGAVTGGRDKDSSTVLVARSSSCLGFRKSNAAHRVHGFTATVLLLGICLFDIPFRNALLLVAPSSGARCRVFASSVTYAFAAIFLNSRFG